MSAFFLIIALVASAFLVVQILMMMFGVEMDFDSDIDVDAGDGGGFLSVRSLTAFFGGFGWAGLAAQQAGWSNAASILVGLAVGLGFFLVAGFLFLQAKKLTSSGNVDYKSTVGSTGSVYLSIPANRSGPGKIEVTASGRISVVSALTDDGEEIPSKTRIRIMEVVDETTVLVERA
ncbi:MAG: hypothetical protein ACR2PK_11670 [Acidimicrobiales bacterium]